MLVLTFAVSGAGNCVEVGGAPFVYARTTLGSFVLPARCSHRGGPLHLARVEPGRARLICPWHEQATSVKRLARTGIPAVRRGEVVTAVFADATPDNWSTGHLPLSPDLDGTSVSV
ncbi:Rieske 2Fe-2S domain-containing protein [Solihabitans fulvus]|nr:Rieske 2Fe-2S domain-containing protein [Solihabitans fulvus]